MFNGLPKWGKCAWDCLALLSALFFFVALGEYRQAQGHAAQMRAEYPAEVIAQAQSFHAGRTFGGWLKGDMPSRPFPSEAERQARVDAMPVDIFVPLDQRMKAQDHEQERIDRLAVGLDDAERKAEASGYVILGSIMLFAFLLGMRPAGPRE